MGSNSSFYSQNSPVYTDTNPPGPNDAPISSNNTQAASSFFKGTGTSSSAVPLPTGVFAFDPVAHQWLTGITNVGVWETAQPAFIDISGIISSSQLPVPTLTTLGGIKSFAGVPNQYVTGIDTFGSVIVARPSVFDLSDAKTGTGAVVLATSPNLITPNIGSAVGASLFTTSGGGFGANPGFGQFFYVNAGALGTSVPGVVFDKTRDATNAVRYAFYDVGGLSGDVNGAAFWRGVQLQGPSITDPSGGASLFPTASFYHEFNSLTAPSTRNFVIDMGNLTSTSQETFRIRSDGADIFTANTTGVAVAGTLNIGGVVTAPSLCLLGTLVSQVSAPSGTVLQISNSGTTRITLDTYASGSPNFTGRFANGTPSAPTAALLNNALFNLTGFGYGTTGFSANARASVSGRAAENWTDTSQGACTLYYTTPLGTTLDAEMRRDQPSGGMSLGNVTFNTTDPGAGNLAVQNGITANVLTITQGGTFGATLGQTFAGTTNQTFCFQNNTLTGTLPVLGVNNSDNVLYVYSRGSGIKWQSAGNLTVMSMTDAGALSVLNTTGSSAPNMGALTVSGGLGVSGGVSANGFTLFGPGTVLNLRSGVGVFFQDPSNTSNFTISHSAVGNLTATFNGAGPIFSFNSAGSLIVSGNITLATSGSYLNFGALVGSSGYGFRDNSGTIECKNSSGSWVPVGSSAITWVSIADFPSLQDALNALPSSGGVVYVPAGTWTQTTAAVVSGKNNIALIGDSSGLSVLKWSNVAGGLTIEFSGAPVNYHDQNILVRGLTFATSAFNGASGGSSGGTSPNTNSTSGCGTALTLKWDAVQTDGQTDSVIEDCEFVPDTGGSNSGAYQNWTMGIALVNARQTFIRGCNFIGSSNAWEVSALGVGIRGFGWTVQTNVQDCSFTSLQSGIYMGGLCEGVYEQFNAYVNCNYRLYLDGNDPTTVGTSTSNVTIGTGSKTFITQAGLDYWPGMQLQAYDGANSMTGIVTSYSGTTLTLNVTSVVGSGTLSSWTIWTNHYISDIKISNGTGDCWTASVWARQTAFGFLHNCELQQGGTNTPFYGVVFHSGNVLWDVHDNVFTDFTTGVSSAGVWVGGAASISVNQNFNIHDNQFREMDYGILISNGANGATFRVHDNANQGAVTTLFSDGTSAALAHDNT